jgi:transcriptional regulator with XRE-family HTH domain
MNAQAGMVSLVRLILDWGLMTADLAHHGNFGRRTAAVRSESVEQESESFSLRLKAALRAAQYSPDSPTQLARQFNTRYTGHPVSIHAARKWLRGEAIPTQAKMRALASWLGVTAEWLRYDGGAPLSRMEPAAQAAHLTPDDFLLIEEWRHLDPETRLIARELIRLLVRRDQAKQGGQS